MEPEVCVQRAPLIWLLQSHAHLFRDVSQTLEGAVWVLNSQAETTAMVEVAADQDTCTLTLNKEWRVTFVIWVPQDPNHDELATVQTLPSSANK